MSFREEEEEQRRERERAAPEAEFVKHDARVFAFEDEFFRRVHGLGADLAFVAACAKFRRHL